MRRMSVSSNSALTLCRCNWPKAGSFSSIGVSTAGWPPSTPFPRGGRCGGALKTIVPIQKASRGSSSSAINLFDSTLNGVMDSADAGTDLILADLLRARHAAHATSNGVIKGRSAPPSFAAARTSARKAPISSPGP